MSACAHTYISNTLNEQKSNLSSEQDGNSTKFQKIDVESKVQLTLTNTHIQGKQKELFTDYYKATKEEDIKNTLNFSFNLLEILINLFFKFIFHTFIG